MQCALQLKGKISRVQAAREQRNRKKALVKYIPDAATAIFAVLDAMADNNARGPKRRKLQADSRLLQVQPKASQTPSPPFPLQHHSRDEGGESHASAFVWPVLKQYVTD